MLGHDFSDPAFQWAAAREENAYKGVTMTRWVAFAETGFLQYPLIIDILEAESAKPHTYDLPLHYNGHMISLSVPYDKALSSMAPLGASDGYQHLWQEASAAGVDGTVTYTWMTGDRMYSFSTASTAGTEFKIVRAGANDPSFHLRPEPALIVREKAPAGKVFVSCVETHGTYDNTTEQSANLVASCEAVKVLSDEAGVLKVRYEFKGGNAVVITIDRKNNIMRIEK